MKKKKTKSKTLHRNMTPDLPQNIVPVGERVFEDKNIYIHQKVYEQIHKFSANKTENEHGGILVGRVLNEMGKENTIIEGFIEAKYNTATPTTLTFTHETWEYFHAEIDRKYKDKKIVGWIHTHPNFGIFLSENDRFIQQNFFTDSNQVAYVVDPIQNDEGFFFWINEKLERCPGFYLFDKNGVKIKQRIWNNEESSEEADEKQSSGFILPLVMVVVIIINLFFILTQSSKINKLESEIHNLKSNMQYMQQVINNQGMIIEQILPIKVPENIDENKKEDKKETEEQMQKTPQNNNISETQKETENVGGNE